MLELTNAELLTLCAILGGWAALFYLCGFDRAITGSALIGVFSIGVVICDVMFNGASPVLEGGMVILALAILPTSFLIYMGGRMARALPFVSKAGAFEDDALA